jgi:hypothetical protein
MPRLGSGIAKMHRQNMANDESAFVADPLLFGIAEVADA